MTVDVHFREPPGLPEGPSLASPAGLSTAGYRDRCSPWEGNITRL